MQNSTAFITKKTRACAASVRATGHGVRLGPPACCGICDSVVGVDASKEEGEIVRLAAR